MNRQIKFRGKRLDNGEWARGYYMAIAGTHKILSFNSDSASGATYHDVDPATIGQYSGLYDRNGLAVYEGDILNNYDDPTPLIVKWDSGYARFALYSPEGKFECDFGSLETRLGIMVDAEVIGNIHDNPIEE